MTNWSEKELNAINASDELQLSSLRADGNLRKPVIIWMVQVEGDLYVRSVNGRNSAWFRGVLVCHEGSIHTGGITKEISFVEINDLTLQDQISTAYREKYNRYPVSYVDHVNSAEALSATLKLLPK